MKKLIYLLTMFLMLNFAFGQEFINIGSTKEEVRKIQGEPTSVQSYQSSNIEIWGYEEAILEFKNGKVVSYNNLNKVLKIGNNNISENNDTLTTTQKLIKAAADPEVRNKYNGGNVTNESSLDVGGSIQAKKIPEEYQEMAEVRGLSPFDLPDDATLQEMQQDYEREKNIRLFIYGFLAVILLFVGYKLGRKFLFNKK